MPSVQNKTIVFTDHAEERGLQIGLTLDQMYDCFSLANRIVGEEKTRLFKRNHGAHRRYYKSGSTIFVVRNEKEMMIVKTVWDDVFTRNENTKLSHQSQSIANL